MIIIEGYHTLIDWAEWRPYKVDESAIWGFELHYRGGGEWFCKVMPKKGDPYEIGHGVGRRGAIDLLNNPKATILKIVNYHSSEDFATEVARLFRQEMVYVATYRVRHQGITRVEIEGIFSNYKAAQARVERLKGDETTKHYDFSVETYGLQIQS